MDTNLYFPSKALQPYISYYRSWQIDTTNQSTISFRDYPQTMMDMTFLFKGEIKIHLNNSLPFSLDKCAFIGQFDKGYHVIPKGPIQLLNIRFKPNGIYPLTKMPLKALVNKQLPLVEVMGKEIEGLYQQLQDQVVDEDKIKLLEKWFLNVYSKKELHYKLDYAIRLIQQNRGLLPVQNLKEKLRVSYKSLDRWFQQKVGLSPKRFSQLTRFYHIINDLENQRNPDWMQLVEDYHFYDQAHFIKEFKQFAGVSPSAYWTQPIQLEQVFPY